MVALWLLLSVPAVFLAGWVVGRYGYRDLPVGEGSELLAMHLAKTNNKELR